MGFLFYLNKMTKQTEETKAEVIEGVPFEYHRRHGGGSFFGLIIIFLGLIFLLNNFGILSWNIWNELWKFWPVLIILLGLKVLMGKSAIARIIFTLLVLFLLAGALVYILNLQGFISFFSIPISR